MTQVKPAAASHLTVVRPSTGALSLRLDDVWQYRELLLLLAWRDIQVRYSQTFLGALWAVLQPLFTMVLFTFFFGVLAKVPTGGTPYAVFALSALLPWQLFSFALSNASMSLVSNSHLLTKVYIPRLIIPLSSVLAGLVDFGIASIFLFAMMIYYHVPFGLPLLALPLLALYAVVSALAVGTLLSALNVAFRDVRHMLPFLTQVWMYLTPIAYPMSIVPERYRVFLALNPLTGVVEGFRWAVLGTPPTDIRLSAVSAGAVLLLFVFALAYFRRVESTFADSL